jgi:hypothetical protein
MQSLETKVLMVGNALVENFEAARGDLGIEAWGNASKSPEFIRKLLSKQRSIIERGKDETRIC